MRSGVRVGVDVGKVRIGVAQSDFHGMIATPVETVSRGAGDVSRIRDIVADRDAVEVVVGLPLALSGNRTESTADAEQFAMLLATALDVPVRMVDERLSTVSATAALRSSGKSSKKGRPVIDQVAAVIILQHALDVERSRDSAPGVVVEPDERP